jgi:hypothetical protein
MTLINKYGQFPTKQQILELCKTPEGNLEAFSWKYDVPKITTEE